MNIVGSKILYRRFLPSPIAVLRRQLTEACALKDAHALGKFGGSMFEFHFHHFINAAILLMTCVTAADVFSDLKVVGRYECSHKMSTIIFATNVLRDMSDI